MNDELMHLGVEVLKNNQFQVKKIFEKIYERPMDAEINHLMGISFQLLNKIDKAIITMKSQ